MRRTQLYLDDQLWNALHVRARLQKTSISELVREATRERYLGKQEQKREAMLAFVGCGRSPSNSPTEPLDAVAIVRELRKGNRLDRLYQK